MSNIVVRRQSVFSGPSISSEQLPLRLQFQWSSTAANNSVVSDNNESFVSSSLDDPRSPRQVFTGSSSFISPKSSGRLLTSSRKSSYLPHLVKNHETSKPLPSTSPLPLLLESIGQSNNPISISYTELHVLPPPVSPVKKSKTESSFPSANNKRTSISIHSELDTKRKSVSTSSLIIDKRKNVSVQHGLETKRENVSVIPPITDKPRRISIQPVVDAKRNSVSISPVIGDKRRSVSISPASDEKQSSLPNHPSANEKRASPSIGNSPTSKKLHKTVTAISLIPLLANKSDNRTVHHAPLVRLGTAQLRKLHVSEKYLDEAKRLYYNAPCRSFIPRVAMV